MPDRPKVVKLAQQGYDAKTAGDENLVYNSNWPLLNIYKSGSWTFNGWGQPAMAIAEHNLGYVPAFWFYANTNITSWQQNYSTGIDSRSEYNGPVVDFPKMNESKLLFDPSLINPANTQAVKLQYYIFNLDITKPYSAPNIKSGGVIGPRNNQTVFKLAKPDKDISSSHLEDYIIHSNARSPMVHAVYPGKTVGDSSLYGKGFTYYHNLGYIPMFFAYLKTVLYSNPGIAVWQLLYIGGGSQQFTIDEQKIQFSDVNAGTEVSLLILKDPFNIEYSINVAV